MGRTRKPPRFKSERFPIKSLSDIDCKKTARVDGDLVTLPALGHSKAQVARHVVQPLHHLGHGRVVHDTLQTAGVKVGRFIAALVHQHRPSPQLQGTIDQAAQRMGPLAHGLAALSLDDGLAG